MDIPRDIQLQEISYDEFNKLYEKPFYLEGYNPVYEGHKKQIKTAIKMIKDSKKPLIIAGAGILKANACEELKEFIDKTNIPVAMTLLGLGSFPGSHDLALGMIGMHGTTYANYAANEADLIIAAGMRFDDRVTGNPQKFLPNAQIDVPIVGDLKNVLSDLNENAPKLLHDEWLKQIKKWKKEYSLIYKKTEDDKLIPQEILFEINKITKGNVIVATDVGQHQMWAAQYMTYENPHSIITSGGAGTMGFGLPAAIGAQVANPNKKVLAIVGDGGFQMTFQELMLMKEYNLPVKIFIINNSYLGMVRQWQELFHKKRYSSVDLSYNPDFIKIGEAYGIKSIQLTNKKDLKKHLKKILESDEAVLVECIVEKEENVYPMIPAGKDVSYIVGKRGVLENE